MVDLELTRTPGDRRLYALAGIGTLRLKGLASRAAIAESGGRAWTIGGQGFFRRVVEATDQAGAVVGRFEPRTLRRGGTLRWGDRELTLSAASSWRERYALADGERELALLDGKGWGRRPLRVTVDETAPEDPGLLLFATFVVRGLAEEAASAAGAGAAAVAGG